MGKILYAEHEGVHILKFVGDVRLTLGPSISAFLDYLGQCERFRSMIIDLTETRGMDSTALGLMAKVAIRIKDAYGSEPSVICPDENINRLLCSMAMDRCCCLVKELARDESDLAELPCPQVSEDDLREEVLSAHRTLMALDADNQARFRDLVEALEEERALSNGGQKASDSIHQPIAS